MGGGSVAHTPLPAGRESQGVEGGGCRGALENAFGAATGSISMASDVSGLDGSWASSASAFRLRPFTEDKDSWVRLESIGARRAEREKVEKEGVVERQESVFVFGGKGTCVNATRPSGGAVTRHLFNTSAHAPPFYF